MYSKSESNISENHYDTIFSTDSFVIARQSECNNSFHEASNPKLPPPIKDSKLFKSKRSKSLSGILDKVITVVQSVNSLSINREKIGLLSGEDNAAT